MACYFLETIKPNLLEEDSIFIAPSADLIGKVTLKARSSVWFGAVLRGDNESIIIGEGSNIQDQSIIHTDVEAPVIIGKNCTIGHRALLHGCLVEDNCLIGMGVIIMNYANIGKNSIVAAGALITEQKNFPPNSLIMGSPAVCKRVLRKEEIEAISRSSSLYQENALRFKKDLYNYEDNPHIQSK